MNNQLIKTCQDLNECEGMGKSPDVLATDSKGIHYVIGRFEALQLAGIQGIEYGSNVSGSYLKIDDQSEWSSAKILARAGWDANKKTLSVWMRGVIYHRPDYGALKVDDNTLPLIEKSLKEGLTELAYMQAIILLYKIDREAYNKGIEPLLGKEDGI